MKKLKSKKSYKSSRYSYKQMWNFASQSRKGSRKQIKWVRRIYSKKIKEAKKSGQWQRVSYLKFKRSNIAANVKKFGVSRQAWQIATMDVADIGKLALEGKLSKDNSKLLVLDASNKAIMIAYEGDEAYDEALAMKQAIYGTVDPDKIAEIMSKLKL